MNYSDINLNNKVITYDRVAGKQGESFVKGIRFILPPEYDDWDVVIDTQNAMGEKNSYEVVRVTNNLVEYSFNAVDLKCKGKLLIDLVLTQGQKVLKPFSGEFAVKEAICPGGSYGDFMPIIITSGISNEIKMNTESRHKHGNQAIIDKFGEDDRGLLYDNEPVGTHHGGGLSSELLGQIEASTEARHTHPNKESVLDKFTLDENGGLLFDGHPIKADCMTEDKIDEKIQEAIASGDFKGEDGKDYILTEADKAEIRDAVLATLPKAEEDVF